MDDVDVGRFFICHGLAVPREIAGEKIVCGPLTDLNDHNCPALFSVVCVVVLH